ncbi:hypothetical protein ABZ916_22240 [Streptomyces sp. NPDC046853]|uniref:hypothetical protein n=1 Tax=Streptomyces sp. NPDC046853 TaxID=3154920 RepID=UPI0033C8BDFB
MRICNPRRGYWCECWTETTTTTTEQQQPRPQLRGTFDAYSAPQADRWVAIALRTITPALDAEAADEAWSWLDEGRIHTRIELLRMQPCTISVTQADTRIAWTIRPVLFLPLAHSKAAELPACAYDLKPQQTD